MQIVATIIKSFTPIPNFSVYLVLYSAEILMPRQHQSESTNAAFMASRITWRPHKRTFSTAADSFELGKMRRNVRGAHFQMELIFETVMVTVSGIGAPAVRSSPFPSGGGKQLLNAGVKSCLAGLM